MTISAVSKQDLHEAIALIQKAALPAQDIDNNIELYAAKENGLLLGTVGIEHNGSLALLRSLSVNETERGKGYGDALVRFVEDVAKQKNITSIYLLTTTADVFFSRKGYATINRNEVPVFITQTSEFSSVCPSSATVMKKQLI